MNHAIRSEGRWELVQRVVSSSAFQRSRRLRQFLLFVCELALRDPLHVIDEHEIGKEVFGRSDDFDPTQDTLVRVHASQLRKRLLQYFASEGVGEQMVIEIPKGSYKPIFRPRHLDPPNAADGSTPGVWLFGSRRHVPPFAMLSLLLAALAGWLLLENRRLHQRFGLLMESKPTVDLLWRQIFGNGKRTYVVLGDSNLTLFQDLVSFQLPLAEYQRQQFGALVQSRLDDPISQDIAYKLKNRPYTSIADANLAQRATLLNAANGIPTEIVFARYASANVFKSHNVIISGPRRANPWLELFEDRLNFRTRFEEQPRRASLENMAPLAGEERRYVVTWDRRGYCRVAYLPNLDSTGSALIISGTDLVSTGAGIEFMTSEQWVSRLRSALGAGDRKPVPYFEVLLQTRLVIGAVSDFELVARRVHRF